MLVSIGVACRRHGCLECGLRLRRGLDDPDVERRPQNARCHRQRRQPGAERFEVGPACNALIPRHVVQSGQQRFIRRPAPGGGSRSDTEVLARARTAQDHASASVFVAYRSLSSLWNVPGRRRASPGGAVDAPALRRTLPIPARDRPRPSLRNRCQRSGRSSRPVRNPPRDSEHAIVPGDLPANPAAGEH